MDNSEEEDRRQSEQVEELVIQVATVSTIVDDSEVDYCA